MAHGFLSLLFTEFRCKTTEGAMIACEAAHLKCHIIQELHLLVSWPGVHTGSIRRFVQRRPLLALSHLRHYQDTMLNGH